MTNRNEGSNVLFVDSEIQIFRGTTCLQWLYYILFFINLCFLPKDHLIYIKPFHFYFPLLSRYNNMLTCQIFVQMEPWLHNSLLPVNTEIMQTAPM